MAHPVHYKEKPSRVTPSWNLLSIIVPSLTAVIGVIVAAFWLRQSNREQNKTEQTKSGNDAFKIVTDQLFELNNGLRADMDNLKKTVFELQDKLRDRDQEVTRLEAALEETDQKWRHQITVTGQLANYIRRLISAWPAAGGTPPTPDPPIDWQGHLVRHP